MFRFVAKWFVIGTVVVVAVSCAPAATPTPTEIPGPKVGRWEGETTLSFEVGNDGNIHDFKLKISVAGSGTCLVEAEQIEVNPDGTFTFVFGKPSKKGENLIRGKFINSTTASVSSSKSLFCVSPDRTALISIGIGDDTRYAEWKGQ